MNNNLHPRLYLPALVILSALLFAIRVSGPEEYMELGQHLQLSYIIDVLENRSWIMPRDMMGDVASKPPLAVWLSAGLCLLFNSRDLTLMYAPGALASLGLALLCFRAGRRWFGSDAGMVAAYAYTLSYFGFRSAAFLRSDPVFAFFCFLSACLAMDIVLGKSAENGRSKSRAWIWFWLAASMATLAKGPLVLIFVAGAWFFSRKTIQQGREKQRSIRCLPRVHPSFVLGLGLYLVITGGWLFLATGVGGARVVEKQIFSELFGHLLKGENNERPFSMAINIPHYFLTGFAPWSLAALVAIWSMRRRCPMDRAQWRAQAFLAAYLLCGLAILAIAPRQRLYYLQPLIPAATVLAAPALLGWKKRYAPAFPWAAIVAATSLIFVLACAYYVREIRPKHHSYRRHQNSAALVAMIRREAPSDLPLTFSDSPYAVQYLLGTHKRQLSVGEARRLLQSEEPAYIVVSHAWNLIKDWPASAPQPLLLMQHPPGLNPFLSLYSNRPGFDRKLWEGSE